MEYVHGPLLRHTASGKLYRPTGRVWPSGAIEVVGWRDGHDFGPVRNIRKDKLEPATAVEFRCRRHGDPLVCLACEAEEAARPEWHLGACPNCGLLPPGEASSAADCCGCEKSPTAND
jgi:hypothetical protein